MRHWPLITSTRLLVKEALYTKWLLLSCAIPVTGAYKKYVLVFAYWHFNHVSCWHVLPGAGALVPVTASHQWKWDFGCPWAGCPQARKNLLSWSAGDRLFLVTFMEPLQVDCLYSLSVDHDQPLGVGQLFASFFGYFQKPSEHGNFGACTRARHVQVPSRLGAVICLPLAVPKEPAWGEGAWLIRGILDTHDSLNRDVWKSKNIWLRVKTWYP